MEIIEYAFHDHGKEGWEIPKVKLGKINLIVGDTGTGKTKFLNTLFNLGKNAVADSVKWTGQWQVVIKIQQNTYEWKLSTKLIDEEVVIEHEELIRLDDQLKIIKRDEKNFEYMEKALPQIAKDVSGIKILRPESIIKPIFTGFSSILRRNFHGDELSKNYKIKMPFGYYNALNKYGLLNANIGVDHKLVLLKEKFNDDYLKIKNSFIEIFPFITDFEFDYLSSGIKDAPLMPVLFFRENEVAERIRASEIASGMQKVLLLLLDTALLPDGGIFLIDEYENSLGVSAIDFFPDYLFSSDNQSQFIITSHHPYIINNIPIEHWLVFHRKGSKVQIKSGKELKKKYGKSKQQHFIQLINDPFYKNGVE